MFHKKIDNSRSTKFYRSKKFFVAGLIATALAFNVFLSDPTDSSNLRSASKRTLAVHVEDKSYQSAKFMGSRLSGSTSPSSSYTNAKNIVRRTQSNDDGSEDVIVHFLPSYDILQTDAAVKIGVDVPGFSPYQLDAEIRNEKVLHISGKRSNEETNEKEEFDVFFEIDPKFVNMKVVSMTLENELLTATAYLKTEADMEDVVVQLEIVEGPPPLGIPIFEGSSEENVEGEVPEEVFSEPEKLEEWTPVPEISEPEKLEEWTPEEVIPEEEKQEEWIQVEEIPEEEKQEEWTPEEEIPEEEKQEEEISEEDKWEEEIPEEETTEEVTE